MEQRQLVLVVPVLTSGAPNLHLTHTIPHCGATLSTTPHPQLIGYQGRIQGVLAYKMGQRNVMGAYPFHFHHLGSISDTSYVRDSAVFRSFYRGVCNLLPTNDKGSIVPSHVAPCTRILCLSEERRGG